MGVVLLGMAAAKASFSLGQTRTRATPRLPAYRTATLLVVSNVGGACRSGHNAQGEGSRPLTAPPV